VRTVNERRGSAAVAATLYQEDPAAKQRRLRLADQHRLAAAVFAYGEGKPSKKERRELRKLKGIDE
ncbi:MAG: RNA-binding S4 domain-containing protein, partial [Anaerolineales bacterium]